MNVNYGKLIEIEIAGGGRSPEIDTMEEEVAEAEIMEAAEDVVVVEEMIEERDEEVEEVVVVKGTDNG